MNRAKALLVVSILVVVGGLLGGVGRSEQPAPAPGSRPATSQATSIPAFTDGKAFSGAKGRWRAYCPDQPTFWTFSPNYVWLHTTGELAQINVSTGDVRLFTRLDGLPLDHAMAELSTFQDDRALLVLASVATPLLWSPAQGWTRLPALPDKSNTLSACFDVDGTILAMPMGNRPGLDVPGTELYEYVHGAWRKRRDIPACEQFVPMKEGLALRLPGKETKDDFARCDVVLLKADDAGASRLIPLGTVNASRRQLCAWLGGRLLEYRPFRWSNELRLPAVRELTGGGYKPVIQEGTFGVDFKAGQFVRTQREPVHGNDWGAIYHITRFADTPVDFYAPTWATDILVSDKAGRLWSGLHCWDGNQVVNRGAKSLTTVWFGQWGDPTICELDMTEGFRPVRPAEAAKLSPYDPATRRGWMRAVKEAPQSPGQALVVVQCVEVDKDGTAKVLCEFPEGQLGFNAKPQVLGHDGSWWGVALTNSIGNEVFRIMPDRQLRKYQVDGARQLSLLVAPNGKLLACPTPEYDGQGMPAETRTLYAYDANADRFTLSPGSWDDLAMRVGPFELAVFAPVDQYGGHSAPVMQKAGGVWKAFHVPFCAAVPWMTARSVLAQRVLMTFPGMGIVEYDGKTNRWARLDDCESSSYHFGVFDGSGRRILMGIGTLIYDGDPFESDGLRAAQPTPQEEKLGRLLLAQLDSGDYQERDKATTELKKLIPKMLSLLEQAALDGNRPLESRTRLETILQEVSEATRQAAMPALLRLDCPLPPMPASQTAGNRQ